MTEETKHNKIKYLPLLLSLLPIVLYDSLFKAFSNYYLITGIGITFLLIWYIIISRNEPALDIKKTFAPKTVGSVLLTSLGVNFISGLIILIILFIIPDMMEEYAEHMDYGVDEITLFLYSVILGPIGEELCFRGVSMSYLKKSNLPMAAVLIIQALLFGVFHGELIQSCYAMVAGLAFGLVAYKTGSLLLAILLHSTNNLLGIYISPFIESFETNSFIIFIVNAVSIMALVIGIMYIWQLKPALKNNLEETPEIIIND